MKRCPFISALSSGHPPFSSSPRWQASCHGLGAFRKIFLGVFLGQGTRLPGPEPAPSLACGSAETCPPRSWHATSLNLCFRNRFPSLQRQDCVTLLDNSRSISRASSSTAISLRTAIAFHSTPPPCQLPPSSEWENRLPQAKPESSHQAARKDEHARPPPPLQQRYTCRSHLYTLAITGFSC